MQTGGVEMSTDVKVQACSGETMGRAVSGMYETG
jgi:hypothetical protein